MDAGSYDWKCIWLLVTPCFFNNLPHLEVTLYVFKENKWVIARHDFVNFIAFLFRRQGRYLLIMTENFAALPRVKQLLLEQKDKEDPYVIFGSGFPKDQLFSQVEIICKFISYWLAQDECK